jgi:uncharacterized membrane protein
MSEGSHKTIEQVVTETAPEALQQIPEEVKPKALRLVAEVVQAVSVTSYSGSLPPAEELAKYNAVLPGAAERILSMTETQLKHRIKMEEIVIPSQQQESAEGQKIGYRIALAFLIGSVAVTIAGYPWVGGVLGGSTIVGLVTVFVLGKQEQRRDLKSKE